MLNDKNLPVCMISGSFEYDSEASLTLFRNYIERNYSPAHHANLQLTICDFDNPSTGSGRRLNPADLQCAIYRAIRSQFPPD